MAHWFPMTISAEDLPKYRELMYPVLVATEALGGSGHKWEIVNRVIDDLAISDEMLSLEYPTREKSVFVDRLEWALSYCKLVGALESPRRALYLLTSEGKKLLALPLDVAVAQLIELDSEVRRKKRSAGELNKDQFDEDPPSGLDEGEDSKWKEVFLSRLHSLSPDQFEEYTLALFRAYGMSLERVGGSGDEGIDGIGIAPMGDLLSSTVAVQCKRYEPSKPITREMVALFQRDAQTKGAERAIMVTLSRYTKPAREAARATTPTVDLIDGERLCDLALEKEFGIRMAPLIDDSWFETFAT